MRIPVFCKTKFPQKKVITKKKTVPCPGVSSWAVYCKIRNHRPAVGVCLFWEPYPLGRRKTGLWVAKAGVPQVRPIGAAQKKALDQGGGVRQPEKNGCCAFCTRVRQRAERAFLIPCRSFPRRSGGDLLSAAHSFRVAHVRRRRRRTARAKLSRDGSIFNCHARRASRCVADPMRRRARQHGASLAGISRAAPRC